MISTMARMVIAVVMAAPNVMIAMSQSVVVL